MALLATTLFWALRSPVSLALLPVLGSRAVGANASYWGLPHHYDLLPAVVLGFATLDALRRHRPGRRTVRLLVVAALVAALAGPLIPRMLAHETPQRLACASRLMTAVPEGDGVAATALLTPRLTHHHPVTQRVRPVHENGATSFPDDQGLPLQAPWVLLDHGAPRTPAKPTGYPRRSASSAPADSRSSPAALTTSCGTGPDDQPGAASQRQGQRPVTQSVGSA